VRKAFAVARSAHDGQVRKSGEPVLAHALATALLLADLGLDEQVVAAGLLHDTLDDTPLTSEQLCALFPHSDVPELVRGVSQVSRASQLLRDHSCPQPAAGAEACEDGMRSMLLAMADVRVVLVKLADRAHNMRTVAALPAAAQRRCAQETLAVFVPLAARLGVWGLKCEMEDACFSVLHPGESAGLAARLAERSADAAAEVEAAKAALAAALEAARVRVLKLAGRPKNLFSVWSKMQKKGLQLEGVLDARGLRVIVADEAAAYAALREVHSLWAPLPDRQKDYIAAPKRNGYRSLHTVVEDSSGRPVEVQIRTAEMHGECERGVAAHWRYKQRAAAEEEEGEDEGEREDAFLEQQVNWARFLLSWESPDCLAAGCVFPTHKHGACPHAHDFPGPFGRSPSDGELDSPDRAAVLPPSPRAAPLFVMLRDATRSRTAARALRVLALPRGATRRHLLAALGSEAARQLRLPGVHLLVNACPRDVDEASLDLPLELASGDLVELVGGDCSTPRASRELTERYMSLMRTAVQPQQQPCFA